MMKERKLWRSPIGSSVETQYVQIEPQRVNMISHEGNIGAYLREPFTHIITIDCCGIPHHDHYPHQHNRQVLGKKQKEAKINNDNNNNFIKRLSTSTLSAGV